MKVDTELSLGYVALVDSAPLLVAHELGLFAREGLQVRLQREPSWASLRDHLLFGDLVAAHSLAPLPMAATIGVASPKIPLVTGMVLSLNGNTVTVSKRLYEELLLVGATTQDTPMALGEALHSIAHSNPAVLPLRFAVVSPVSNHHYQLRHWLRAARLDLARDVVIGVVPPQYMVDALRNDEIDAFCVGEPWGTQAAMEGVGQPIVSSYSLWNNVMEKVLAVREDWAVREPEMHQALLRALLAAGRWLDSEPNRQRAATWIAKTIEVPKPAVAAALRGAIPGMPQLPDGHVFFRYLAQYPWQEHGLWLAEQMQIAGQWPAGIAPQSIVQRVYRGDLYRQAAAAMAAPIPINEQSGLGLHPGPWKLTGPTRDIPMGPTEIFDRKQPRNTF
ncbi:CmpA/NrtA family ABC transporter substrate-binding protein [Acidithiobacillus caldus]|uniref:Nitrate transporter n=1 Tax=Acidithiobacillus caldus TaxID=33059 RepID=A0A1E7YNM6_9PROT|nr:CmpA/NrtA family ABC transporter substrate-binding protein [Acidithiobacillus caldus]MBU2802223.1 ABC transporter substrate-binding protein [Acidithiobacillus caldus]OFC36742.1 nitrate transporter [Acidithiobacillus caldus]OFC37390.1 nitrate transporter [Acidithiobacillus caldus]OFC40429.1 nitrate transporter [Acidithiobacillus caldus]